ncbi:putative Glycylpeptide N-tetradecanoyltransferase [Paratrimastix pyriformis]|uniref:glycylpeptide N-tetradecanoyltransferase n=1 Tax=Paratrimastix pyriformis TaxID=342808 RepID=A0ABQ8URS6_9EUKA|nr:putative Glycylpeptide N-tetradecanoyltransferase [Paratrimastix pyriformis]
MSDAQRILQTQQEAMVERQINELLRREKGPHAFWDTQPVPHRESELAPSISGMRPLENAQTKVIRRDPLPLPPGFEWFTVDVDNQSEMQKLFDLLSEHYVEDTEGMFRFRYSIPFLRWALKPPGYLRAWHVGVRVISTGKYVGFISGVPSTVRTDAQEHRMAEINFLCVHKALRAKRLAPVLISEITRRVNLEGIFQAVYTAGVEIPTPICQARYFHRPA